MGATNSKRVSHVLTDLPTPFRDDQLAQIINDLSEEDTGVGFSEVQRTGVFVDKIIGWETSAKLKKRTETSFTRAGAFLTTIVKDVFDEEGLGTVAQIVANITRNTNKTVKDVTVTVTRI